MTSPEDMFLQNLGLIERITAVVCRRKGMTPEEIEEFAAEMKVRLIEDDYAVIRRFQGRSSFATYLVAVIANTLLDYRIQIWGKFNPSSEARRLGDRAVELERRLYRDEQTLDEAFEALRVRYPEISRAEFEAMAERLPHRMKRRRVELHADVAQIEPHVLNVEHALVAHRVSEIVNRFIDGLPPTDQTILLLRFRTAMTVPEIARATHVDQKRLYRKLEGWFRALHTELVAAGLTARDIDEIVGRDPQFLDFRLDERVLSAAQTASPGYEPAEEQHV